MTAPVLEALLAEKQQTGLSAQTVNHIRAAGSVVFTRSKEAGWWTGANPASEVRKRKVPQRVGEWLRPHVPSVLLAAEQTMAQASPAHSPWRSTQDCGVGKCLGSRSATWTS